MSDLQTALSSALKEWEPSTEGTVIEAATPAPTPTPPKTNLTREAFFLVRENPGITRAEALKRLDDMGFKRDSTSSIMSQLVRAKMVDIDENDCLSTKRVVYTSLTHALTKAPKKRRKTKAKVQPPKVQVVDKPKAVEAAPKPQATPAPAPAPTPTPAPSFQRVSAENVDEWLETVPLLVARKLYWKLHAIFGGAV